MNDFQRELEYYRQLSNDLGVRTLRLQNELTQARREAKRNQTTSRLVRELYNLASNQRTLKEITHQFVYLIIETLQVDRAALVEFFPDQKQFSPVYALGFSKAECPIFVLPAQPATYCFANSTTGPDPVLDSLRQAAGGPYLLWVFDAQAKLALLASNSIEDQHLHRPFEENDREIIESALNIYVEITERKKAETQLQTSLKEKDILLKEIHHRVKNNLQVISSLLNLQSDFLRDKQVQEVFQDSYRRVHSMTLIHEKLYQSAQLTHIDFSQYTRDLAIFVARTQDAYRQGIRLEFETEPVSLDVDIAIPAGLALSELISNAIKHAFPNDRAGQITIKLLNKDPDNLTLIVADNGCGFPPGLNFRNPETLGLILINTLVTNQLNGTIELHHNNGTAFTIAFSPNRLI